MRSTYDTRSPARAEKIFMKAIVNMRFALLFVSVFVWAGCSYDFAGSRLPCESQRDCEVSCLLCSSPPPEFTCTRIDATRRACLTAAEIRALDTTIPPETFVPPDPCELGQVGYTVCDGECVSTLDNPEHCGACNAPAFACKSGKPRFATAIRAGAYTTCAIVDDGHVYCWGSNAHGQVSHEEDALHVYTPAPSAGINLASEQHRDPVSVGDYYTCLNSSRGDLWCWGGRNPVESASPTYADGDSLQAPGSGWSLLGEATTSVDIGERHGCAVTENGQVLCWGAGEKGQLGKDSLENTSDLEPFIVDDLNDAVEVRVADGFSCATRSDGSVWCWGDATQGRLGNDLVSGFRAQPAPIAGLGQVSMFDLSTGYGCGVRALDGSVWCWGEDVPEPGGEARSHSQPQQIPGISEASLVRAGPDVACALTASRGLLCWGEDNGNLLSTFALGGDGLRHISFEDPVVGFDLHHHICVLSESGLIRCWGDRRNGRLGTGVFREIELARGAKSTATTLSSTCWIDDSDAVRCLGEHIVTNATHDPSQAIPLPDEREARALVAAPRVACVLSEDGLVWCWGHLDEYGLLDEVAEVPARIANLDDARSLSLGEGFACGLWDDGRMSCVGSGTSGQLGDGLAQTSTSPVEVRFKEDVEVVEVASGSAHACALDTKGALWCWGSNKGGRLGDGTELDRALPVKIIPDGVEGVTLGDQHSCALLADRTVSCWGDNHFGQLGDDEGDFATRPAAVQNLGGVSSLQASRYHTCATTFDGEVKCWGQNGAIGDGGYLGYTPRDSPQFTHEPVNVVGLGRATSVSVGPNHACATDRMSRLWCWGSNDSGQIQASRRHLAPSPELVQVRER